jgi:hypothetical protein
MSEAELQADILPWLWERYPEALSLRRNTGAMRDKHGRMVRFGMPGMADVFMIRNGQAIEIELKSTSGKQAQAQKDWQAAVERAGGIYILARCQEDIIEVLG